MKVAFVGCVESSYRTLETLISSGVLEVVAIVTKDVSSFNADLMSLKDVAELNNIPYFLDVGNNQHRLLSWLRQTSADALFCVGWPYLIGEPILRCFPNRAIGYHPSDLPRNRGRHPIIWALFLGLEYTASTFFCMTKGPDEGAIVDKVKIPILPDDDARILYDRLIDSATVQIVRVAKALKDDRLPLEVQDISVGNVWRKRTKKDGLIDWRMSSEAIFNLVRSLTHPYVGAHCQYRGEDVKVWKIEKLDDVIKNIEPGKVLMVDGTSISVKTMNGAVKLVSHEFRTLPNVGDYL